MSQVAWQVFIIFIPVIAVCIWLEQYYISSARELARLIGTCKAPVTQHFAETISGSSTIRSFDQESRFQDASVAGLAVTYGLNLNIIQAWVVWNLCMMENKIISVERILQYTALPSEPPLTIESNRPDPSWPSCGEVDFNNLQVRYAPHMPFVLRGLTCTFSGGKKTGIVSSCWTNKNRWYRHLLNWSA